MPDKTVLKVKKFELSYFFKKKMGNFELGLSIDQFLWPFKYPPIVVKTSNRSLDVFIMQTNIDMNEIKCS